jgi:hypothetical protein
MDRGCPLSSCLGSSLDPARIGSNAATCKPCDDSACGLATFRVEPNASHAPVTRSTDLSTTAGNRCRRNWFEPVLPWILAAYSLIDRYFPASRSIGRPTIANAFSLRWRSAYVRRAGSPRARAPPDLRAADEGAGGSDHADFATSCPMLTIRAKICQLHCSGARGPTARRRLPEPHATAPSDGRQGTTASSSGTRSDRGERRALLC